mgnify:CR=1 FL=1
MKLKTGLLFSLGLAALIWSAACSGGPALNLDPESASFYETARLIMSKEEEKIFKLLPDVAARQEFIRDFWDRRDPDPETEANEFRNEFLARVKYAAQRFNEGGRGWNTDRGRVYIYMGPPDKFEEIFNHGDPEIRGPVLLWIYYNYQLGIEFADEKGTGEYKIRRYDGDFFGAMDLLKMGGWVGPSDVFKKRVVDFGASYDREKREIVVSLPARDIIFRENEEGGFFVELEFKIIIYSREGARLGVVDEARTFLTTVRELDGLKEVTFRFGYALPPGRNFIDVLITAGGGRTGRVRRVFEVKAGA